MIAYIVLKQSVPFDLSYTFELPKREFLHLEVAMKSSNKLTVRKWEVFLVF